MPLTRRSGVKNPDAENVSRFQQRKRRGGSRRPIDSSDTARRAARLASRAAKARGEVLRDTHSRVRAYTMAASLTFRAAVAAPAQMFASKITVSASAKVRHDARATADRARSRAAILPSCIISRELDAKVKCERGAPRRPRRAAVFTPRRASHPARDVPATSLRGLVDARGATSSGVSRRSRREDAGQQPARSRTAGGKKYHRLARRAGKRRCGLCFFRPLAVSRCRRRRR